MLKRLNEKIKSCDFWDDEYLSNIDIDETLNLRDEKEFDSEWIRIYELTQKNLIDEENQKIIDEIRENSFRSIYDRTSSAELASYVSDDFELVCKAYVMKIEDAWLASLFYEYINRRIPCGKMSDVTIGFQELVKKFIL